MLIQIPVFIGLYYVVRRISVGDIPATWIYSFFTSFGGQYIVPININHTFLGMNLLATHNIVLTILGAILTFFQTKFTTLAQPKTPAIPGQKTPDMSKMM